MGAYSLEETRLIAAAERYRDANQARATALAELQEEILKCDAAGISRSSIVSLARLARQTVYNTLQQSTRARVER